MNDELIKKAAHKYAGLGNYLTGERIVSGVVTGAIMFGLAKAVDALTDYFDQRKMERKDKEYYENMLKAHPELQREDPEVVAKLWASLYHFAPYMAEDPTAAGAFIRQSIQKGHMEEFGGPAPETFNTLADTNKKALETTHGFRNRLSDEASKLWLHSIAGSMSQSGN